MKILDLNMLLFFPVDSGGKAGIYYRVKDLAKENDVYTVIVNSENEAINLTSEYNLSDRLHIRIYSPVTKPIKQTTKFEKIFQTISWLFSGKPRMAEKISNERLRQLITDYAIQIKPDIIFLESPFVYELLNWSRIDRKQVRVINVVHNQEVEFFKAANNWPRGLKNIEISRIREYEKNVMEFSDSVRCVSPSDAKYGKSLVGDKCEYVPSHLVRAERKWNPSNSGEKYIYFSGALSFNPNLEGLIWFLDKIYTQYIMKHKNVTLKITGKVSADIKSRLSKYKQVEFTGYLSNHELEKLIIGSIFTVIPLLSGGGVKMKMLEAMKYGVPAVSTEHVRDGVAVNKNERVPFLYTNKTQQFLEYMNALTMDHELGKKISDDEYTYFENVYSSEENLNRWMRIK